jgi:hypothetical protein
MDASNHQNKGKPERGKKFLLKMLSFPEETPIGSQRFLDLFPANCLRRYAAAGASPARFS